MRLSSVDDDEIHKSKSQLHKII